MTEQAETANERFERLAAEFQRETGMVAPGKDSAMAAGASDWTDYEARMAAWVEWVRGRERGDSLRQRLELVRDHLNAITADGTFDDCCPNRADAAELRAALSIVGELLVARALPEEE